jgi:hypothetical protein
LAIGEKQVLDHTDTSHGLEVLKILEATEAEQTAFTKAAKAGLAAYLASNESLLNQLGIADEGETEEAKQARLAYREEVAEEVEALRRGR